MIIVLSAIYHDNYVGYRIVKKLYNSIYLIFWSVNNRVLLSVGKKIQIVSISDNFLQNLSDPTLREAGTTRNGMVARF